MAKTTHGDAGASDGQPAAEFPASGRPVSISRSAAIRAGQLDLAPRDLPRHGRYFGFQFVVSFCLIAQAFRARASVLFVIFSMQRRPEHREQSTNMKRSMSSAAI